MPDILIRGISMPHGKDHITITINADGTVQKLMDVYCKVVAEATELPSHGDLIDRDAFIDLLPCGDIEHDEKIWRTAAIADAIFLAQETPVVIPSNKEGSE